VRYPFGRHRSDVKSPVRGLLPICAHSAAEASGKKSCRDRPNRRKIISRPNKIAAAASSNKTVEMHMPSKNERVELEMKIMKYRQLARRVTDEELLKRFAEQIADLEQKLREIDE
jgi:hypothetical protein